MATLNAELSAKPTRQSAGQDARLYGRRDARRYPKQIRSSLSFSAPSVRHPCRTSTYNKITISVGATSANMPLLTELRENPSAHSTRIPHLRCCLANAAHDEFLMPRRKGAETQRSSHGFLAPRCIVSLHSVWLGSSSHHTNRRKRVGLQDAVAIATLAQCSSSDSRLALTERPIHERPQRNKSRAERNNPQRPTGCFGARRDEADEHRLADFGLKDL